MPIQRRVPKRGFKNPDRVVFEIVNIGDLDALEETEISPEVLADHRLADLGKPVKLLADGAISRKVTVRVHAASASAKAKIEAAGGSVELLED
jgi:large subunit ribosomal protein L15